MNYHFHAKHGPILVDAEVTGPARSMPLSLILDTGATTTLSFRSGRITLI